jgi:predicted RNA methylase
VTLVDIDEDAIEIAKQNIQNLELESSINIMHMNVNHIGESFNKKFDMVLTNPPFGIRSHKSADISFLKKAVNV